jgi:exonuclease SbcC
MRLHRLELTALGPFAGSHVVDLDGLGTDGLFLLHGETGAGKSSVLDAIAYALFGVVPGVRHKAHRLRCDRADPWTATSVRLELTVAGHRVRVRRTHDWLRPKRRGTGSTREPATALLEERRKDVWVGLSTRIDEVSHQLLDWIGMSAEQFFQVVLLPQGEFAQFLLAESKDRERLLERLFGTERFSDVQRWLTDRQVDCKLRAEAGEATMRAYVNRLGQELGLPVVDEATFRGADETWRAAQVAGTGVRAAVSLQAAAEADQARVEARAAGAAAANAARSRSTAASRSCRRRRSTSSS